MATKDKRKETPWRFVSKNGIGTWRRTNPRKPQASDKHRPPAAESPDPAKVGAAIRLLNADPPRTNSQVARRSGLRLLQVEALEKKIIAEEEANLAQQVGSTTPTREVEAYLLSLEGLSNSEIAQRMGIEIGTVRIYKQHGKKKLRSQEELS